MKQNRIQELATELDAVLRKRDAERFARAILATYERYRGGFMGYDPMKSHVASLWGTVDARGLKTDVERLMV
jgi:hypothetical protein